MCVCVWGGYVRVRGEGGGGSVRVTPWVWMHVCLCVYEGVYVGVWVCERE